MEAQFTVRSIRDKKKFPLAQCVTFSCASDFFVPDKKMYVPVYLCIINNIIMGNVKYYRIQQYNYLKYF